MSYRFLDGTPVNGAPVEPFAATADVIVQRGGYQCGACGSILKFEPCKIAAAEYAVGWCTNWHEPDCGYPHCTLHENNCRMAKVRLKIPIERIACEIVPEPEKT